MFSRSMSKPSRAWIRADAALPMKKPLNSTSFIGSEKYTYQTRTLADGHNGIAKVRMDLDSFRDKATCIGKTVGLRLDQIWDLTPRRYLSRSSD